MFPLPVRFFFFWNAPFHSKSKWNIRCARRTLWKIHDCRLKGNSFSVCIIIIISLALIWWSVRFDGVSPRCRGRHKNGEMIQTNVGRTDWMNVQTHSHERIGKATTATDIILASEAIGNLHMKFNVRNIGWKQPQNGWRFVSPTKIYFVYFSSVLIFKMPQHPCIFMVISWECERNFSFPLHCALTSTATILDIPILFFFSHLHITVVHRFVAL